MVADKLYLMIAFFCTFRSGTSLAVCTVLSLGNAHRDGALRNIRSRSLATPNKLESSQARGLHTVQYHLLAWYSASAKVP